MGTLLSAIGPCQRTGAVLVLALSSELWWGFFFISEQYFQALPRVRRERENICYWQNFHLNWGCCSVQHVLNQTLSPQRKAANYMRGGKKKKNNVGKGREKSQKLMWNPAGNMPVMRHLDLNKAGGKAWITHPALCCSAAASPESSFLHLPIRLTLQNERQNNAKSRAFKK